MFEFIEGNEYLTDGNVSLKLIETNYGNEDILPYYYYEIYNSSNNFVGKISIRIGDNFNAYYNGHIGYEIFENYRGNNYSFYSAKLVLNVAKLHKMTKLYLSCKKTNIASIKIIEKLGAANKKIVSIPKTCFFYYDDIEDYCVYTLILDTIIEKDV